MTRPHDHKRTRDQKGEGQHVPRPRRVLGIVAVLLVAALTGYGAWAALTGSNAIGMSTVAEEEAELAAQGTPKSEEKKSDESKSGKDKAGKKKAKKKESGKKASDKNSDKSSDAAKTSSPKSKDKKSEGSGKESEVKDGQGVADSAQAQEQASDPTPADQPQIVEQTQVEVPDAQPQAQTVEEYVTYPDDSTYAYVDPVSHETSSNAAPVEYVPSSGPSIQVEPTYEAAPAADPEPTSVTVAIVVDGTLAGGPYRDVTVTLPAGANVYDALVASGAAVNARDTVYGVYVASIDGLAEKAHGGMSGWVYAVNGVEPQTACSNYQLTDGDVVQWTYVNVEN